MVPDGSGFNYDYYLTDHLGSTRMVVNDEQDVTEALMYQPYGTMQDVVPPASEMAVREKFTRKELYDEGTT